MLPWSGSPREGAMRRRRKREVRIVTRAMSQTTFTVAMGLALGVILALVWYRRPERLVVSPAGLRQAGIL